MAYTVHHFQAGAVLPAASLNDIDNAIAALDSGKLDKTATATTASKLASTGTAAYGTCATAAGTAAKVVSIADSNWKLVTGTVIAIKFTNSNTASSVTLNVNNSGAKSIWYSDAAYTGNSTMVTGYANRYIYYIYDGTYWVWLHCNWNTNGDTYPSAYCGTAAATAAKAATMTYYTATAKSYVHVNFRYANTAASAITLNINSKGAKPIYINGSASSATNYTLPAGSYIAYYDGTNYYFRTDGKLTGDITGSAASATNADTVDGIHGNQLSRSLVYSSGKDFNTLASTLPSSLGMINTATASPDTSKSAWWHYIQANYNNTSGGGNGTSNFWTTQIANNPGSVDLYVRSRSGGDDITTGWSAWTKLWRNGDSITSSVWNDYAEYREVNTTEGGRCVREIGDDTLELTDKRLMRGCEITSDTWGFAQGKTEKANTPIAVAGRVLAYPLEDRELFRNYIGYSVCSGPNGTVSLMTEEEEMKYPWAIVGTVSAVPDYEEWGGGELADRDPVKVNGRIWIKIK